jgi:hypothetical protein
MKIELPPIYHAGIPLNDLSNPATAWLESFHERAAIMQHDGGLSVPDAEKQAREICNREFGRVVAA